MSASPRSYHPLSHWIAEFQRHQPDAGPSDAWRFLRDVAAPTGALPWLSVRGESVLIKRPTREHPLEQSRSAFTRQFERIKARSRQAT